MAEQKDIGKALLDNAPILLTIGGGALAYIFVIKPLLETVGLKDSKEDKEFAKEEKKQDLASFDPKFNTKAPKGSGLFDSKTGKALAKKIYDAKGFFNDNEDKVYSTFKMCKAKSDVSIIAFYFNQAYSKDLHSYLDFLSQSEKTRVYSLINSLPNYRKASNVTSVTTQAKVKAAVKKVEPKKLARRR